MTLSRMIIRVGIDVIPKEAASACCASVSTLAKTASGCCSEARSKMGANIRHGPHQDAQKSTRARSAPAITVSKFSAVSSTVAMVFLLGACGHHRYPMGYATAVRPQPFPRAPAAGALLIAAFAGPDVVVGPVMTKECSGWSNHDNTWREGGR